MAQLLTFEYSSVHGALAAAYTSGALAAEFGPEQVRVALTVDAEERGWTDPLIAELTLEDAELRRWDTRLLGVVDDGDGPAWALLTSHVNLERQSAVLVRTLGAILQARPHRRPTLSAQTRSECGGWICDAPLRAANILVIEDFVAGAARLAA
ncbi:MAG TPA: hypothetical protein VGH11_06720 [Jatrophihabitans sp.]|jgi:hypothetical protein